MQMISYIQIDDRRIEFAGGKPTNLPKTLPRRLDNGYAFQEYMFNQEIERRNFIYQISPIYAYIRRNIPVVNLSMSLFTGLARVFSNELQVPIYREHYRRLTNVIFWLEMNYQKILDYISNHTFKVCYMNIEFPFN